MLFKINFRQTYLFHKSLILIIKRYQGYTKAILTLYQGYIKAII